MVFSIFQISCQCFSLTDSKLGLFWQEFLPVESPRDAGASLETVDDIADSILRSRESSLHVIGVKYLNLEGLDFSHHWSVNHYLIYLLDLLIH